jgi:hypothetical protein
MNFNAVQFLPAGEFPTDSGQGYAPTNLFAPESGQGTPDDLRALSHSGGAVRSVAGVPGDFFHAATVTPDGRSLAVGGQPGPLGVRRESSTGSATVIRFPPPPRP